MPTGATGQLGLALPVQGELTGTWGNTVNNAITEYTNIAIAATLTLTNDGAVTLANTTGTDLATNIVSSLTGAGTATAQFAIVRVTGTLTTPKIITAPSYSKTYVVVNAATGSTVSFIRSGQTPAVSIAVGESAFVYYNGTDYVKVSSTVATGVTSFTAGTTGFTPSTATTGAVTLAGTLATTNGGTGLTSFTSGGVVYASSSSALATGSALTFDGTSAVSIGTGGTGSVTAKITLSGSNANNYGAQIVGQRNGSSTWILGDTSSILGGATTGLTYYVYGDTPFIWYNGGTSAEQMRLTSTGLGIGTSSPTEKLQVVGKILSTGDGRIGVKKDGSDSVGAGPFFGMEKGDATRAWFMQLGASNTFDWWYYSGGATYTKYMSLDASGNLGLGVTPSAWNTDYRVYQLAGGGSLSNNGGSTFLALSQNAFVNSSSQNTYIATAAATRYRQSAGTHLWDIAASGTAGDAITFTQAMTLDASGNLLVGATSTVGSYKGLFSSNGQQLAINNPSGQYSQFSFYNAGSSKATVYWDNTNSLYKFDTDVSASIVFSSNSTERARIDTSGNLLVGGTAARGTTVGTKHLDLFDGTAPAGTLTNGVSLYSSSGDLKFMNAAGDAFDVGYRNIPQNSQSANYTLVLGDAGDHIFHPVGDNNARTFTIPANSSVAFPIGTAITFINMAAANVTIAITTDTLTLSPAGTSGSRTLAQYGSATCIKITSTQWLISGSGLT
jgi:hypothetical protein